MLEGRAIQSHLQSKHPAMQEEKVKVALQLLSKKEAGLPLQLKDSVDRGP